LGYGGVDHRHSGRLMTELSRHQSAREKPTGNGSAGASITGRPWKVVAPEQARIVT
jgi:hypothetical protein